MTLGAVAAGPADDARRGLGQKAIRQQFGETITALGQERADFVVLTADLMHATGLGGFGELFPERLMNLGIAEQNMAGVAAGLALCGKLPIVSGYAAFTSLRAVEQAKLGAAYNGVKVIFAAQSAGLSYGVGGPTHQTYEDLAVMRSIPTMIVLSPSDAHETDRCLRAALAHPESRPIYIRLGRGPEYLFNEPEQPFEIGQIVRLRAGGDVCLVATGPMVIEALLASHMLGAQGVDAAVLNVHTIKPLDAAALREAAAGVGALVTIEEHSIHGGLGAAVLEALAETPAPKVRLLGIPDQFPPIGPTRELRIAMGLCAERIAAEAMDLLGRRSVPSPA